MEKDVAILQKLMILPQVIVVVLDLHMILTLTPALQLVHVKVAAISTVVMRLITSCIEPGLKSIHLILPIKMITSCSMRIGLPHSKLGGKMVF